MRIINQPGDGFFYVPKPIYGFKESQEYWLQTFKRYHREELNMKQSILDSCLFLKKENIKTVGLVGTPADDTLGCAN